MRRRLPVVGGLIFLSVGIMTYVLFSSGYAHVVSVDSEVLNQRSELLLGNNQEPPSPSDRYYLVRYSVSVQSIIPFQLHSLHTTLSLPAASHVYVVPEAFANNLDAFKHRVISFGFIIEQSSETSLDVATNHGELTICPTNRHRVCIRAD